MTERCHPSPIVVPRSALVSLQVVAVVFRQLLLVYLSLVAGLIPFLADYTLFLHYLPFPPQSCPSRFSEIRSLHRLGVLHHKELFDRPQRVQCVPVSPVRNVTQKSPNKEDQNTKSIGVVEDLSRVLLPTSCLWVSLSSSAVVRLSCSWSRALVDGSLCAGPCFGYEKQLNSFSVRETFCRNLDMACTAG